MKVRVFIERENKRMDVDIPSKATVKSLLEKLKLNPVTVLISVNDEICTEETTLKEKDSVEIFSVVSGG